MFFWFENGFLQVKLSYLYITSCISSCVYSKFNLRCFMSLFTLHNIYTSLSPLWVHLYIYFLINMVYFKNSLWWKKIPLIPLILLNKKLISNFKDKAKTILMLSLHLSALLFLMIVLYTVQTILFLMLVYYPFNSKTKIFLRLYVPLTIIEPMVMMIYL